ncbi:MAG: alcohol dehydrogenase catalytic domain-containing protein [Candidatus Lokiarchaeota archaeon]|nr:alcohol dehydrogenase catalytic domain-containing protein [Candidatus Lokiarchaeota archaeon]MBD3199952.1 alcohol dehydrogenase catalytic domain-containing protein [Candidatus Lokiarchaeota archaeon]
MKKMLAAIFHKDIKNSGGEIILEKTTIPEITKKDEVLIKVEACGICGTDLKIMQGGHPANDQTILGHEFVGTIMELGNNVYDLKPGDKIAIDPNEKCGICRPCRRGNPNLCEHLASGTTFGIFQNGGFAEYSIVPRSSIFKLPNDITMTHAALIEPLSCAVHCHNIAEVKESDNIVIIGAGPMGLIIESLIRTHPLKNLIMIELDDWRRQKAIELGADHVINPKESDIKNDIDYITDKQGADVIIDAVGLGETFEMAQQIWAHGGRLICFGQDNRAIAQIKPNEIVRYQRSILGSYISDSCDFLDAIEIISNKMIDLEKLITHIIPLDQLISKGFKLMKEKRCLKIITQP